MTETLKGQIISFIKNKKKCRTRDVSIKFGNSGAVWTALAQLRADKILGIETINNINYLRIK